MCPLDGYKIFLEKKLARIEKKIKTMDVPGLSTHEREILDSLNKERGTIASKLDLERRQIPLLHQEDV